MKTHPFNEEEAWRKWNAEQRPMRPTAEQSLTWLDGWREFMFEVWRNNPELLARHERSRDKKHSR